MATDVSQDLSEIWGKMKTTIRSASPQAISFRADIDTFLATVVV